MLPLDVQLPDLPFENWGSAFPTALAAIAAALETTTTFSEGMDSSLEI
jgi:hypothetical protein